MRQCQTGYVTFVKKTTLHEIMQTLKNECERHDERRQVEHRRYVGKM